MNRRVSVIIPIFNAEKTLSKCIKSIENQTYTNLEIILINDGSNDSSLDICDKFFMKNKNIKIITQDNRGVSAARNLGLKNASGEYIQFVDSDDFLERECIEKLVYNMESENTDLVICGMNIIKNGVVLRSPKLERKLIKIKDDFSNYKYITPIFASPCNKLYKRKFLKNKFVEELSWGEDLVNNLYYLREIESIVISEKCLYNVVLDNENSLNRKFDIKKLDKIIALRKREAEILKDIYGNNFDEQYTLNEILMGIHFYFKNLISLKKNDTYFKMSRKYFEDNELQEFVESVFPKRIDYRVFKFLFKNKYKYLLYIFFKIKEFRRV